MNKLSVYPTTQYKLSDYENTMPSSKVLIFMTGFCLGMVFFYLSGKQFTEDSGLLGVTTIRQLKACTINRQELLQYVTSVRVRQILLLLLCATSSLAGVLLHGILGWCGFELGVLLFSAVYQYGMKGLLLSLLLFFPQGIFYGLIFFRIFGNAMREEISYVPARNKAEKRKWKKSVKYFQKAILILILLILGIFCESYMNPGMLQKMSLFF